MNDSIKVNRKLETTLLITNRGRRYVGNWFKEKQIYWVWLTGLVVLIGLVGLYYSLSAFTPNAFHQYMLPLSRIKPAKDI